MSLTVHQFPCLQDNYCFLVRDGRSGAVACIDPPDANVVVKELQAVQWDFDLILNTHWHRDHIDRNEELSRLTGAKIIAFAEVRLRTRVDRIICLVIRWSLGQLFSTCSIPAAKLPSMLVILIPPAGRPSSATRYFAMGCGRIFEGTPEQMWASLGRLTALPPSTMIYCAHEYTEANGRFALEHDRSHAVAERVRDVRVVRSQGQWTVPTTIELELATNPFLRAPALRPLLEPVEALASLRAAKDVFAG